MKIVTVAELASELEKVLALDVTVAVLLRAQNNTFVRIISVISRNLFDSPLTVD